MSPPPEILDAWDLADTSATPITSGLINQTFLVHGPDPLILQRLNPIFGPEVNEDIEAVTAHLARAGMQTPRLVRTVDGEPWSRDLEGMVWRALTWVEGETVTTVDSADRARSAGALLGRFHRCLADFEPAFRHRRVGVHDTPRHLAALRRALHRHPEHRNLRQVEPLARAILELAGAQAPCPTLPERVVHGDPKITNIIFTDDGAARCLVDLDTLARMPVHLELGDALRSWCNPAGEEAPGQLDLELTAAALEGYASSVGGMLTDAERGALPGAAQLIATELAARFCADALEERYFGWDRARHTSASDHNLVRARSQLALARSARQRAKDVQYIVEALFGP